MLQISIGKYFRDVPLHVTPHRRVLFTNARFTSKSALQLGEVVLLPSDDAGSAIATVTVEMIERLEAVRPDGGHEMMASTGGTEMLDDLAYVLSFALNTTFSRDSELVRRLVVSDGGLLSPRRVLRRTFDPSVLISADNVKEAAQLLGSLLALNRKSYERAMRAIRQLVDATRRVADDPTLSYTMFVAALEALAPDDAAPPFPWSDLDGRKRKLIDEAVNGLDDTDIQRIRAAVIEAERAGAKRRFIAFVLANLTPPYFREDAVAAIRPASRLELEKALKLAYDIRSRNVHELEDLLPETWALGDRAETVNPRRQGLMLSLEGLNRLARSVVREFITHAPTEQTEKFDYRTVLPNMYRAELAPQYWIGSPISLSKETAGWYFDGLVSVLLETLAPTAGADADSPGSSALPMPVDLRSVLTQIEKDIAHISGRPRLCLIGVYWLWHRFLRADVHMTSAEGFLKKYGPELFPPSMQSFVAACLAGDEPEWSTEQLQRLADDERAYRAQRNSDPLPKVFNAALEAAVAIRLDGDGHREAAIAQLSRAVEEFPGSGTLINAEATYAAGGPLELDLRSFALRR